jgi:hypothetical protein
MTTSKKELDSRSNYEAILKTKDNKYYFYIKELQIISTGNTIESAHQELVRKKGALLKEFEDAGSLVKLPIPSTTTTQDVKVRDIGLFAIKSLILGFTVILMVSFASNKISQGLTSKAMSLKSLLRDSPIRITRGLEREINHAAQLDIPPERIEVVRSNLRKLVKQLKPFAEEIWPLLPNYPKPTEDIKKISTPHAG